MQRIKSARSRLFNDALSLEKWWHARACSLKKKSSYTPKKSEKFEKIPKNSRIFFQDLKSVHLILEWKTPRWHVNYRRDLNFGEANSNFLVWWHQLDIRLALSWQRGSFAFTDVWDWKGNEKASFWFDCRHLTAIFYISIGSCRHLFSRRSHTAANTQN